MSLASNRRRDKVGTFLQRAILEELESRRLLAAVPAPLVSVDVGTPTGGSASYDTSATEFTIVGAGQDLFAANDAFHYVYQPLTGDGSVVVRVDSDSPNGGLSLAGIDIRSSLNTDAANMWLATRDTGGVFVDDRPTDGGIGTNVAPVQGVTTFPRYLKLTRNGNSITASTSTDGTNYTTLVTDTIALPATALVGMAVASQNAPTPNATATFGAFAVTGATPLTATLTSAQPITPSTTAPYPFTVTYTDSTGVKASTIGTGNLLVTGPGGYSQQATLASTGLVDGPSVAATYNLNPVPTTPGTYTITSLPNQVTDTSGNPLAGGTVIGTFVVSGASGSTSAIAGGVIFADGTILQGRTVFLDTNNDGVLDNGETSTTSDSSSGFTFLNLAPGTYHVVQVPSAGQQVLEPTGDSATVTVAAGQEADVPNFVDIASNTPGATTNLQLAFSGTPPTTGRLGKVSHVTVTVTNSGTTTVKKRVRIAVLATFDGTIADKADAIRFVNVHLKAKASQTFTFPVRYKKTLAVGTYKLVATIDPDGVVAESSKLDNSAVSGDVTVTA